MLRLATQGKLLRQQGSALMLALLIAAMVSLMSVRFAESFMLQLNVTEAQDDARLISVYLSGAEQLAVQLLSADAAGNQAGNIDHEQEIWAQPVPPLPTDHGWLHVRVTDAQSLFNLNNLLIKTGYSDDAGAPLTVRLSPAQKQFVRLLQSFEDYPISETDAVLLTEALIDWIDEDDQTTGQGGAESLYYSTAGQNTIALDQAIQAANQPLFDVSELMLVRHFTPEIVERLRPWVVVLPAPTALNINTAPAMLLATINQPDVLQPLESAGVQTLLRGRQRGVFAAVSDFFDSPDMQTLVPDAETSSGSSDAALFAVNSDWFQLHSTISVNDSRTRWLSVLARTEQKTSVWKRHRTY
ncbi:general secretion pathway protein GspK [Gammaproteobacteria bacterium LSUCC0112]|nr:general secretion pathway protein GspK [Gammaproteobacteria bacterium LSUCC0112]